MEKEFNKSLQKETKLIKDNKVNPAIAGGAVAGAAVLGVGGTAAAMHFADGAEDEEALDLDAQAEEIEINGDFNPDMPVDGLASLFGGNSETADTSAQHTPSTPRHPQSGRAVVTEEEPEPDKIDTEDTEQPLEAQSLEDVNDTPVNADEVIAMTAVDENDNETPELLSWESVELVPEEDGTVHVNAQFSMQGEEYTMVDIDNDGTFDVVADAAGDVQGSAAGMMLSDVELAANENNDSYMAANDYDNNSETSATGESSLEDMVEI